MNQPLWLPLPQGFTPPDLFPGHIPVRDENGRWLQCHQTSIDMARNFLQERTARLAALAHAKDLETKLATTSARADKLEQQLTEIERTAATLKGILDISAEGNILGAHVFLARAVSAPESTYHPTEPLPRPIRGHTHAQVDLTQPPIDIFPQM